MPENNMSKFTVSLTLDDLGKIRTDSSSNASDGGLDRGCDLKNRLIFLKASLEEMKSKTGSQS